LETQDVKNLQDYFGITSSDDNKINNELLSNFHFLTYISITGILDKVNNKHQGVFFLIFYKQIEK